MLLEARVDAVGGDHDVGRDPRTIGERNHGFGVVLLEVNTAMAGVHDVRRELRDQYSQQVGAMQAVELDRVGQARPATCAR